MNKKDLAKKGRFGDTEIRKVDGKPAHVNPQEAKLIDRKGRLGELIVKSQGAGTTNPETGHREYFLGMTVAGVIAAVKVVAAVVTAGAAAYGAWKAGDIAAEEYDAAVEKNDAEKAFLEKKYKNEIDAYNRQWGPGGFQELVYKESKAAYGRESDYIDELYTNEVKTAEDLREAYRESGKMSDAEKAIMDRQQKIIEEGDPMQNQIAQEELSRVTGAIRGQGTQAIQRAQGQAIGQGLEGSIVARELVRQTDRDTLKQLSETARDMAIANQRSQMQYKREAQGRLDTMSLVIDARKRQSLLNIAGIADPVKRFQGPAPVDPLTGKPTAPTMGVPGVAPVDYSSQYYGQAWGAGGQGVTDLFTEGDD